MRLIDADELMEHAWRDKLDSRELIAEMIEKAPTIKEIPTNIPIDVFEKLISSEPKTGHWSRKTKVDAYDIAGVKTWGIKCQCDRCDFTTIVVEDFGYYKYCPNCGCRMVEPQESEEV